MMQFSRVTLVFFAVSLSLVAADFPQVEYLVLATGKTSTMEKELNQAADSGYVFASVMGGNTAWGGSEVVVVMMRAPDTTGNRKYRLLATSKTSTMQKELQQAGAEGYEYCGKTVFKSKFGGAEAAIIVERKADTPATLIEYRLLATSKTSTMQKELKEAGDAGFTLLGMSVGETAFGGAEVVSILERREE